MLLGDALGRRHDNSPSKSSQLFRSTDFLPVRLLSVKNGCVHFLLDLRTDSGQLGRILAVVGQFLAAELFGQLRLLISADSEAGSHYNARPRDAARVSRVFGNVFGVVFVVSGEQGSFSKKLICRKNLVENTILLKDTVEFIFYVITREIIIYFLVKFSKIFFVKTPQK